MSKIARDVEKWVDTKMVRGGQNWVDANGVVWHVFQTRMERGDRDYRFRRVYAYTYDIDKLGFNGRSSGKLCYYIRDFMDVYQFASTRTRIYRK